MSHGKGEEEQRKGQSNRCGIGKGQGGAKQCLFVNFRQFSGLYMFINIGILNNTWDGINHSIPSGIQQLLQTYLQSAGFVVTV